MPPLPSQVTPFVGRTDELAAIRGLLANPDCRLLTLIGAGGIGKTRLALQTATEMMPVFADGVYFVSLASLSTPDHIVSTLSGTLAISFHNEADILDQLIQYLRQKHLLLVLDNFEHLLNGADLLPDLLHAAPDVKLLVTSRERLNLHEEWLFEVYGLSIPENEWAGSVEDYSAMQLFMQNARRVKADFALTPETQTDVIRVCQLVEGMPLAIELASSWVRTLACMEIVGEIERSLNLLSTTMRNMPERHRSMRAVFDHSWRLLSYDEQNVFKRLSVFWGGFTREAVEQVAGASLLILASLVDKSLLRFQSNGRYSLHFLLRQYGEEKLTESAEADEATQDLHAHYFTDLMHLCVDDLFKGIRTPISATIDLEAENVRVAFLRSVERDRLEDVRKAVESLFYFYDTRGWYKVGLETFRRADEILSKNIESASEEHTRLRAWIRTFEAGFLQHFARYDEAEQLLQNSLKVLRPLREGVEIIWTLGQLGGVARRHNDSHVPRRYYEEGVSLARRLNLTRAAVLGSIDLSAAVLMEEEFAEAHQLTESALALCREMDHQYGETILLRSLSYIAFNQGDITDAKYWAHEGLAVAEKLGFPRNIIEAHYNVGNMHYEEGQHLQAKPHYEKALALAKEQGDLWAIVMGLKSMGSVMAHAGQFLQARHYFSEASRTAQKINVPLMLIEVVKAVTDLLIAEGKREWALEILSFLEGHPSRDATVRRHVSFSISNLQGSFSTSDFFAARERGQKLSLDAVIRSLLEYLRQPPQIPSAEESTAQSDIDALNARELEILRQIADGLTTEQVAQKLFLSIETIRWYLKQIYSKLDVHGRVQAIARARELRLLA